jgi:hypothetical protein
MKNVQMDEYTHCNYSPTVYGDFGVVSVELL